MKSNHFLVLAASLTMSGLILSPLQGLCSDKAVSGKDEYNRYCRPNLLDKDSSQNLFPSKFCEQFKKDHEIDFKKFWDELNDGGSSSVGPANPSAVLCDKVGGTYVRVKDVLGESALCKIQDALIEPWTLWKTLNNFYNPKTKSTDVEDAPLAVKAYFGELDENGSGFVSTTPTVAQLKSYCSGIKGKVTQVENDQNEVISLCVFTDNSSIELLTLYEGPFVDGHELLTYLLTLH